MHVQMAYEAPPLDFRQPAPKRRGEISNEGHRLAPIAPQLLDLARHVATRSQQSSHRVSVREEDLTAPLKGMRMKGRLRFGVHAAARDRVQRGNAVRVPAQGR